MKKGSSSVEGVLRNRDSRSSVVAEAFSFVPSAKRGGAEERGGFGRVLRNREAFQIAALGFFHTEPWRHGAVVGNSLFLV
jgi:hypothetical protein